jgi:hypothetical protein
MPEHRIRFRGGWEVETLEGLETPNRVILPVHWPVEFSGRVGFRRRFGRPRSRFPGETYRLELLQVPGLIELTLNGTELHPFQQQGLDLVYALEDPLLDRNILELAVDLDQVLPSSLTEGWGMISLVIVLESAEEE